MVGMSKRAIIAVGDCLEPLALGATRKALQRDYKPSGRFPIVDQGQNLIAGWTDDDAGLISTNLPVVVFGDHTRRFKYVDFPFVRGADGTQILRPKSGMDPLFFYYACKAIDLPTRAYNRHLKALKEREIPKPPRHEQVGIAQALLRIECAISSQDEQIRTLAELKRAAMQALFTRGIRGDVQKETEIGPLPENWELKPLCDHFSVVSGGTPSRRISEFWHNGCIPWVKTTEIDYCVIQETEEYVTQAGMNQSAAKLLLPGTLLLAMYGQGVTRGKVAILGVEATCNQACAAIAPKDCIVDAKYLYHFLSFRYESIRQLAHGGQQQNLNLEIVRNLPIAIPEDKDSQREIVSILDAIDRKINLHRRKRAVLGDLFKVLLHKLMTGEIWVTHLDLSALVHDAKRQGNI
ncbi:MAG: restriction endonuclease subunit S [Gemmatimonadetes bacterium]|nr:restriction endonuclease subunit S [Gemmatimonadota bacterium]